MDPYGGAQRLQPTKTKKGNKPSRPLSAYNFFFKEERARLVEESNRNGNAAVFAEAADGAQGKGERASFFGALGKVIGRHWKKLSPKEREKYVAMAEQDKLRYKKEREEFRDRMFQESPLYLASQQGKMSTSGGDRGSNEQTTVADSQRQIVGMSWQSNARAYDHQLEFGGPSATGRPLLDQHSSTFFPGQEAATTGSIPQGLEADWPLRLANSRISSLMQQQQIRQNLLLDQLSRRSEHVQQPRQHLGNTSERYLLLQLLQQQERQAALSHRLQPNLALPGVNTGLALSDATRDGMGHHGDSGQHDVSSLLRIQRESQELEELLRTHRHRDL